MIYLDTSVALAHLQDKNRQPPDSRWRETLVSSRLLEYEEWTQLHARGLAGSHREAARALLGRVATLELAPPVLTRVLDAFPGLDGVRTLDALHLASCAYLPDRGQSVALASYDRRTSAVAHTMEIPSYNLTRYGNEATSGTEVTTVELARREGVASKRFRRTTIDCLYSRNTLANVRRSWTSRFATAFIIVVFMRLSIIISGENGEI